MITNFALDRLATTKVITLPARMESLAFATFCVAMDTFNVKMDLMKIHVQYVLLETVFSKEPKHIHASTGTPDDPYVLIHVMTLTTCVKTILMKIVNMSHL